MRKIVIILTGFLLSICSVQAVSDNSYLCLSDSTLNLIYKYYSTEQSEYLFNETYPFNPKNVATYTLSQDTIGKKRVAYLWPTSGVFSGVVALLRNTGDKKYKTLLDDKILPGLNLYLDSKRQPACYQSYLASEGTSDRFYDDNVWLVIDFAEAYLATKDQAYLEKAETVWKFVISGWDNKLGGGIYWCEQNKHSKNTCSNAPSVVAAAKLYEATNDSVYLKKAIQIYGWTKTKLQDKSDFLYFDNIKMDGKLGKTKYAYNSGQMLQGAAMLYKITKEEIYLHDAQNIAPSALQFFTEEIERNGSKYRVFREKGAWFVTVLSRGYFELFHIDKNPNYVNFFKENIKYLQQYARYDNGLFYGDWSGLKSDKYKWLLDQACIVELSANLSAF